jgi:glycosyltransferase involved in cell wall biosynthesis
VTARPLRIALVAPLVSPIAEPFLGGSQALLSDLATGLAARGHAVTLFAADGSRVPGAEMVTLGIDAALMRPAAFSAPQPDDAAARERERVAFLRIAYEVRRRAADFDLVHNHAFDAPAFELLGQSHPRVAHTLHLPPVIDSVVEAAAAACRESAMVTVSRAMAGAWRPWIGWSRTILNGVPADRITPGSPVPGRWLFVGRIAPEKGIEDALAAAESAGRRLRVVGGVYDAAYHARLESRLERHDVIGAQPRDRVFHEMASAEGLLMPARWQEPFGLTAVEAMAAGTPVAAYACGALPEVIADGVSGLLVPVGDVEALAGAARRLHTLDRGACRRWAQSRFDLERMVDEYVELYRELA